jgi:hypothetical protein
MFSCPSNIKESKAMKNKKKEKRRKMQWDTNYVTGEGEQQMYCFETSQVVPCRPSGKGNLEARHSDGK